MRIFNSDGSEAEMCGNGARCVAYWAKMQKVYSSLKEISFDTEAGIIKAKVSLSSVKVKLTCPADLLFDSELEVFGRKLKINYVNILRLLNIIHNQIGIDLPDKTFKHRSRPDLKKSCHSFSGNILNRFDPLDR